MTKHIKAADLPDDIARIAQAQVAAGLSRMLRALSVAPWKISSVGTTRRWPGFAPP
jgi:hypothetical protein